jgi:hypothetical protein
MRSQLKTLGWRADDELMVEQSAQDALYFLMRAAVDCGELRSACVANCANIVDNPARLQACANRCSIGVCPTIPSTCRAGDQTVCRNGFSSCNGACDALAAIPTAAAIVNASACSAKCCTNFKACLSQPAT